MLEDIDRIKKEGKFKKEHLVEMGYMDPSDDERAQ